MIDRQMVLNINWSMLLVVLLLFLAGLLNLYSAGAYRLGDGTSLMTTFYSKQLVWGGVGFIALILAMLVDYQRLKVLSWYIYGLSLLCLIAVFFWGVSIHGSQRWLDLGIFSFQPSVVAKVATLILLAHVLSQFNHYLGIKELCKIFAIILVPVGLIIKQPDLGSALILLFVAVGIILYHGIAKRVLKVLALAFPLVLPLGWLMLHDYQKTRLLSFLNPAQDPQGAGYHVIQSQIALGSGGFWGKGFMEGTQSQLRFLPEKHTDFAFSVFGEEWGFIGALILLILFCTLLYQILSVSQQAKDKLGTMLCVGAFFYFFWQILVNIGMVLGLLPVVGIPLPFISYGGTALVINFIIVGLVMNVAMRRFMFKS